MGPDRHVSVSAVWLWSHRHDPRLLRLGPIRSNNRIGTTFSNWVAEPRSLPCLVGNLLAVAASPNGLLRPSPPVLVPVLDRRSNPEIQRLNTVRSDKSRN